jgi:hypothetical protein
VDRINDAVSRDTQKAEHETLQEECKRLRIELAAADRVGCWAARIGGFALGAFVITAFNLGWAIDDREALREVAATLRTRLDSERARYNACFDDRERDEAANPVRDCGLVMTSGDYKLFTCWGGGR